VVQYLLGYGVQVDQTTPDGSTALICAADRGHLSVVECLLAHQAKVDHQYLWGNTALRHAAGGGHEAVVQCLLDHGAQVDRMNQKKSTALLLAADRGHLSVVECLLAHQATVDHQDQEGNTALMHASFFGYREIVDCLLYYKADVNQQNWQGETALSFALKEGQYAVLPLLALQYRDEAGDTGLMYVIRQGSAAAVKSLLSHGSVSLQERNRYGETALSIATRAGQSDTVSLLLAATQPSCRDLIFCYWMAGELADKTLQQRLRAVLPDYLQARLSHIVMALRVIIEALPDYCQCPIATTLLCRAVTAADGHTFSEDCLHTWLSGHDWSPMTRRQITMTDCYPNYSLQKVLHTFMVRVIDSILRRLQPYRYSASQSVQRLLTAKATGELPPAVEINAIFRGCFPTDSDDSHPLYAPASTVLSQGDLPAQTRTMPYSCSDPHHPPTPAGDRAGKRQLPYDRLSPLPSTPLPLARPLDQRIILPTVERPLGNHKKQPSSPLYSLDHHRHEGPPST